MGKIDMKRVLLGGLLAGVVINVLEALGSLVTGAEFEASLAALNRTMPTDARVMIWYVALSFIFGIGIVWLYAAIRPRFGAGPRTAVIAGLAVWFFSGLINAMGWAPIGILTTKAHVFWLVQWLIELPLAALAGAWLYKEGTSDM